MTLSQTIESYIQGGHRGTTHSMGDEFSIIDNPSFAILPNHPYRSPLIVAVYCRGGRGTGRINAKTFDLEAGGFFIVLTGQITEMVDISPDFEATYILMSEEFTSSLTIGNSFNLRNVVTESPYAQLSAEARRALEDYISMCCNTIATEQNPHRLEILRLLTHAFFLGMGYFLHSAKSENDDRGTRLTDDFLRLVEENYREHRELKFYAERMGLTPKYISTTIKRASGHSATEWIERYVMLDAITLLTSTDLTIKEIAYTLNFPSPSFFGKYFARIEGISPAKYRERYK